MKKKLFSIVLMLLLSLSLFSCNNEKEAISIYGVIN